MARIQATIAPSIGPRGWGNAAKVVKAAAFTFVRRNALTISSTRSPSPEPKTVVGAADAVEVRFPAVHPFVGPTLKTAKGRGYLWPIWPLLGRGLRLGANYWRIFLRRPISDDEIRRFQIVPPKP